jgi:thiol-disulfide isomerase/thioredoxin
VRKYFTVLAVTSLLISGCSFGGGATKATQEGTGSVRIAPDNRGTPLTIAGTTLTDRNFSTSSVKGIIVVNAWASWCRNCLFEWRDLQTIARNNPEVKFLGLNESDSKQAATKFIADHPTSYEHIYDRDNHVLNQIRGLPSVAIPTTIVLDKQHRLAARIMGPIDLRNLEEIVTSLKTE